MGKKLQIFLTNMQNSCFYRCKLNIFKKYKSLQKIATLVLTPNGSLRTTSGGLISSQPCLITSALTLSITLSVSVVPLSFKKSNFKIFILSKLTFSSKFPENFRQKIVYRYLPVKQAV